MTAHVVFTAFDPVLPATTSATMIREVIRGFIGFDGLLMSDDISMGALSRLDRRAHAAPRSRPAATWCSIATASSTRCGRSRPRRRSLPGEAARRAAAALAAAAQPSPIDLAAARREFAGLMEHAVSHERRHLSFEGEIGAERASDEPALVVDVEGFEGPLDLLLALARQQKVDLAKISILALADQYLAFIEAARKLRLELAADYLVMAAWLAYLKSRLLLPEVADPGRPERRGHGERAGLAAEAAGSVPRGLRPS